MRIIYLWMISQASIPSYINQSSISASNDIPALHRITKYDRVSFERFSQLRAGFIWFSSVISLFLDPFGAISLHWLSRDVRNFNYLLCSQIPYIWQGAAPRLKFENQSIAHWSRWRFTVRSLTFVLAMAFPICLAWEIEELIRDGIHEDREQHLVRWKGSGLVEWVNFLGPFVSSQRCSRGEILCSWPDRLVDSDFLVWWIDNDLSWFSRRCHCRCKITEK
jgi:hypothetical protein